MGYIRNGKVVLTAKDKAKAEERRRNRPLGWQPHRRTYRAKAETIRQLLAGGNWQRTSADLTDGARDAHRLRIHWGLRNLGDIASQYTGSLHPWADASCNPAYAQGIAAHLDFEERRLNHLRAVAFGLTEKLPHLRLSAADISALGAWLAERQ